MGKSLTDVAKAILMNEGTVPSVSSSDNNPDRDAKASNPNRASLKPKSKHGDADPKKNDATDLGGATPTSTAKDNLGAKAAAGVSKDKSKAGVPVVGPEQNKSLKEDETVEGEVVSEEEEIEISEELAAFIEEQIQAGLSEEEIEAAIAENFELVTEEEGSEEETVSEETEEETELPVIEVQPVDMTEHVDALLEGESLSEDFRSKATTIFESAVNNRVKEEIAVLEEAYTKALAEAVAAKQAELEEKVDSFLNYVVENWISENEVAIESSLRTELTEDFMAGLKNLCLEHNFDLPEAKVPMVEALAADRDEIKARLDEEIAKNVELVKTISEAKKFEVLVAETENLTTTQAEKLKQLAEGVEFVSEEDFTQKLKTLKESYFPAKSAKPAELDTLEENGNKMLSEGTDSRMAAYVRTLGKTSLVK
jgi:hypothetical protein